MSETQQPRLTGADVAEYLEHNPQFFEEHADLISRLVIPHPHGGRAISITERQMVTLRDKVKELEAKLAELIHFGEENDVIAGKVSNDRVTFTLNRNQLNGAMLARMADSETMTVTVSVLVDDEMIPVIGMNLKRVDRGSVGSIANR